MHIIHRTGLRSRSHLLSRKVQAAHSRQETERNNIDAIEREIHKSSVQRLSKGGPPKCELRKKKSQHVGNDNDS